MKKTTLSLLLALFVFIALLSCKKNDSNNEAGLSAETTPANNSNNLNILGPDFPLKIEIKSVMPPNGVKIEVAAKVEGSTTAAFFTATNTSNAPQNTYTITNTPSGVTCIVNVTITSLTKASNTWMGSYRYSKK